MGLGKESKQILRVLEMIAFILALPLVACKAISYGRVSGVLVAWQIVNPGWIVCYGADMRFYSGSEAYSLEMVSVGLRESRVLGVGVNKA